MEQSVFVILKSKHMAGYHKVQTLHFAQNLNFVFCAKFEFCILHFLEGAENMRRVEIWADGGKWRLSPERKPSREGNWRWEGAQVYQVEEFLNLELWYFVFCICTFCNSCFPCCYFIWSLKAVSQNNCGVPSVFGLLHAQGIQQLYVLLLQPPVENFKVFAHMWRRTAAW